MDHLASQNYYRPKAPPIGGVPTPQPIPQSAAVLLARLTQYSGGPRLQPPMTAPIVTSPPPGTVVTKPATTRPVDPAKMRSELIASWRQMSTLLDTKWKRHLELPYTVMVPGTNINITELETTLARYDKVQKDPAFTALASRPEFISTHKRLREYTNVVKKTPKKPEDTLSLPPPPLRTLGPPPTDAPRR